MKQKMLWHIVILLFLRRWLTLAILEIFPVVQRPVTAHCVSRYQGIYLCS